VLNKFLAFTGMEREPTVNANQLLARARSADDRSPK